MAADLGATVAPAGDAVDAIRAACPDGVVSAPAVFDISRATAYRYRYEVVIRAGRLDPR